MASSLCSGDKPLMRMPATVWRRNRLRRKKLHRIKTGKPGDRNTARRETAASGASAEEEPADQVRKLSALGQAAGVERSVQTPHSGPSAALPEKRSGRLEGGVLVGHRAGGRSLCSVAGATVLERVCDLCCDSGIFDRRIPFRKGCLLVLFVPQKCTTAANPANGTIGQMNVSMVSFQYHVHES